MKDKPGEELRRIKSMYAARGEDLPDVYWAEVWQFTTQGEHVEFSIPKPLGDSPPKKYPRYRNPRYKMERCLTKKAFLKKWSHMYSKKSLKSAWAIKLYRSRNRSIGRLIELFGTIATIPGYFVTLVVDRTQRPCESIKAENRVFDDFKKN
jgi:hypothetical protein